MSEKIDGFLQSLEERGDGLFEIVVRLRELVTATYPDLEETFQYGGLLYREGSLPFTGVFARRAYVTVELVGGARIDDPHGHLHGKGGEQDRKHVHLSTLAEIDEKHVADYLALAWEARQ